MTEINYFLDFRFHAYFYLFTVYRSGTLHSRTHVVWINLRESTFKSTSFRQMRHVEVWQFIVKLLTYPAGLSVFSLVDSRGECALFCYKARRKRLEHERSVGRNTRRSLPTSSCFIIKKPLNSLSITFNFKTNFIPKANNSVVSMLYTLIKHASISQSESLLEWFK